jgi:hypothetical protein
MEEEELAAGQGWAYWLVERTLDWEEEDRGGVKADEDGACSGEGESV